MTQVRDVGVDLLARPRALHGDLESLAIAEAQLDGGVGLDRGELLDRYPLAGAISAKEAVRRPSTGQLQLVGSDRTALAVARVLGRYDTGVARSTNPTDRLAEVRLEHEDPGVDVQVVAGATHGVAFGARG